MRRVFYLHRRRDDQVYALYRSRNEAQDPFVAPVRTFCKAVWEQLTGIVLQPGQTKRVFIRVSTTPG
jgi:hypothetical protein